MDEHGHRCMVALKMCALMYSGADIVGLLPCVTYQMNVIMDV